MRFDPLVNHPACDPACDAACNHEQQERQLDGRHAIGEQCCDEGCYLTEQDYIQTVLGRGFGVHAEEVKEYHQIDGTSADAEKAGHDPKAQADEHTGEPAFDGSSVDLILM